MNYSGYSGSGFNGSIIMVDGNSNGTRFQDSKSSPYDENVIIGLIYFGVSLIFGIPILMLLLCVYKMRGDVPHDNLKEVCCCEFC